MKKEKFTFNKFKQKYKYGCAKKCCQTCRFYKSWYGGWSCCHPEIDDEERDRYSYPYMFCKAWKVK